MSTIYYETDYLMHHGIKGQKWGVRRYQNEDGSLTSAGVKRYGTVENFNKSQEYKKGLKRATIEGGLVGRALYKSKHTSGNSQNDEVQIKASKQQSEKKESHFSADGKMKIRNTDTGITREAKKDWNNLSDSDFMSKYQTSKKSYAKDVEKYGDPYAHRAGKRGKSQADARVDLRQIKAQQSINKNIADHTIKRRRATAVSSITSLAAFTTGHDYVGLALYGAGSAYNKVDKAKQARELRSEIDSYRKDAADIRRKYKR